jgi:hypothetical protein
MALKVLWHRFKMRVTICKNSSSFNLNEPILVQLSFTFDHFVAYFK